MLYVSIARSFAWVMVVTVLGKVLNLRTRLSFSSHLRSGSRNITNKYGLRVSPCILPQTDLDWEGAGVCCEMGSMK